MSVGLVSMTPWGFCMQSRQLSVVGWNIFLWMVLGFVLSRVLYFLMAILQLIVVCLVVILYTSILSVFPIVARSSIHFICSVWLVGSGGMLIFKGASRAWMSGWL